jgi:hypothetical protein
MRIGVAAVALGVEVPPRHLFEKFHNQPNGLRRFERNWKSPPIVLGSLLAARSPCLRLRARYFGRDLCLRTCLDLYIWPPNRIRGVTLNANHEVSQTIDTRFNVKADYFLEKSEECFALSRKGR